MSNAPPILPPYSIDQWLDDLARTGSWSTGLDKRPDLRGEFFRKWQGPLYRKWLLGQSDKPETHANAVTVRAARGRDVTPGARERRGLSQFMLSRPPRREREAGVVVPTTYRAGLMI